MSFRYLSSAFFIAVVSCEIFRRNGSYRIDEKYAIKTLSRKSRLQCAQRCKSIGECKSYSFSETLQRCVLYSVHSIQGFLIADALWEFYDTPHGDMVSIFMCYLLWYVLRLFWIDQLKIKKKLKILKGRVKFYILRSWMWY